MGTTAGRGKAPRLHRSAVLAQVPATGAAALPKSGEGHLGITMEIEWVQAYLRRLLGSERIRVVAPHRAGPKTGVALGEKVRHAAP